MIELGVGLVSFEEDFTYQITGTKELWVGDFVEYLFALLVGRDDLVFPENLEVLAEVGLGKIKHFLDLPHRK